MKGQGRKPRSEPKSPDAGGSEALAWPANRFLQVHFEEIHLGIAGLREEIALQRRQLDDLRRLLLSRSRRAESTAEDSLRDDPPLLPFPGRKN